ncbi:MAG: hypothetical protein IJT28_08275 [Bacteroidaceae bacterium]|nr:hypothetical protein [Bacteroidaceae bacterium]
MLAHRDEFEDGVLCAYLKIARSGMIDEWHKYCQKQMRKSYHDLDQKILFANSKVSVSDFASKQLKYPLERGDTHAWDKLLSVLYSPPERKKIEWAIGAIVSGDSRTIQKFMVFYGAAGTGKSTVLNIIAKMFEGYVTTFDAKSLGNSNRSFALEPFRDLPLVAIQHDGDLSHIEDNTRLNSIVSHEPVLLEIKNKSAYPVKLGCFLFMGTNKPVKITDSNSGLMRRLIDVVPTGEKIPRKEYNELVKQAEFELGAIAHKCLDEYLDHPDAYDDYRPLRMLGASNDFYNYIIWPKTWDAFTKNEAVTATSAWELYQEYNKFAQTKYPYTWRPFKEELKNYFREFHERKTLDDGVRYRAVYIGFKEDKFGDDAPKTPQADAPTHTSWIDLRFIPSLLDDMLADCPAQEAGSKGTPPLYWANAKTKLKDIHTNKLHYVQPPSNLIVIDFDIPDENGEKSLERNLEAASKWPRTYCEVSKSGKALHLHYIYNGDVSLLSRIYDRNIEVKVFTGNSSLRRCVSLCNDIPVATFTGILPLREVKKTVDFKEIKDAKVLQRLILRCMLPKDDPDRINPEGTKPAVDFIFKLLEDAYNSQLSYDFSDMKNVVTAFANQSSHQAGNCLKMVTKMHFKSKDREPKVGGYSLEEPNLYYDTEVLPNLFLTNYKDAEDYTPDDFKTWADYIHELWTNHKPIFRLMNPKPPQVERFMELFKDRAVDFNGRRYDRTILYTRMLGGDNDAIFKKSVAIVNNDKNAINNEAAKWGRTDIYDFASAGNKMSLKKLEIAMGAFHKEFEHPWDQPLPEDRWEEVASYCDNDVLATEAAFHYLKADWEARVMLSELTGLTPNDTTNQQTTALIFGSNRNTRDHLVYRNLAEPVTELRPDILEFLMKVKPDMVKWWRENTGSYLPYFPGYKYEKGISTYRGEEIGEGGYVFATPGVWGKVGLEDSASHHPSSAICECLFGPEYTMHYYELLSARVAIKHKDWDALGKVLGGKLAPYIDRLKSGEIKPKNLSNALKTAINSVYGLTSASFDNPFRDPRNVDNIVAKRGALFMVDLKHAVQEKGFTVAHIKTDSIKIPDATPEIIQFVMDFGKRYGYSFEHEATYDKMCLVNDAVYIAKYETAEHCQEMYGYCPEDNKDHPGQWTATGKQFQVPYVFKTLFSREPLEFKDMCETISVTSSLYLDMDENLPEGEHDYHFVGRVGQFTPVVKGAGGGVLYRKKDDKYAAATGTKGYRWMESAMVKDLGKESDIDYGYYDRLVNEAVKSIEKYGVDIEWFTSEDRYDVPPEG